MREIETRKNLTIIAELGKESLKLVSLFKGNYFLYPWRQWLMLGRNNGIIKGWFSWSLMTCYLSSPKLSKSYPWKRNFPPICFSNDKIETKAAFLKSASFSSFSLKPTFLNFSNSIHRMTNVRMTDTCDRTFYFPNLSLPWWCSRGAQLLNDKRRQGETCKKPIQSQWSFVGRWWTVNWMFDRMPKSFGE